MANAVRSGFLMLLVDAEEMIGKRASTVRITPGYKLEKLPKTSVFTRRLPTNIIFLERDHSLFIYLPDNKQSASVSTPRVTREDDHSVRVDLKKVTTPDIHADTGIHSITSSPFNSNRTSHKTTRDSIYCCV